MTKLRVILILFGIFVFALILRVWFLPQNSLTFGYDQARDAYISQQIINGDLKIQGPPASTPGLYHGVFYYYLLAPAYWLGGGNPIVAAYWIAFLNSLTIFIVFGLGYLMTRKVGVGFLAAFLFAISFESSQYATWLSNPTVGVWAVPLIYLGLWHWLAARNSKAKVGWGPIVCAIGLGLSVQAEIFLTYHIIPIVIWLFVSRKEITKKQLLSFFVCLSLILSTILLSQVKFGLTGIGGLRQLLLGQETSLAYAKSIGDYLVLYLNQIGRIFAFNTYPGNIGYGGGLIIILILISIVRSKGLVLTPKLFLSIWLLSHLAVVTLGGTSTPFLMVGIGSGVSLLLAVFLFEWFQDYKLMTVIILAVITFGNISVIMRENRNGSTLFAIQKDMLLSKQLSLIDNTYQKAKERPFSINSLTSPLWINIVWTYLYRWYGEPKYGYLPEWHGKDQVGQLDSLPNTTPGTTKYFLILEPMAGIPTRYLEETLGEEDTKSILIDEKYFGELRIQERKRL